MLAFARFALKYALIWITFGAKHGSESALLAMQVTFDQISTVIMIRNRIVKAVLIFIGKP